MTITQTSPIDIETKPGNHSDTDIKDIRLKKIINQNQVLDEEVCDLVERAIDLKEEDFTYL